MGPWYNGDEGLETSILMLLYETLQENMRSLWKGKTEDRILILKKRHLFLLLQLNPPISTHLLRFVNGLGKSKNRAAHTAA